MSDNEERHYLAIDYIEEGTMPPERRANLRALMAELRELRAAKAEPLTIDRDALAKWLTDMGATVTREHGDEQVEWINAPLDVVLDQIAHLSAQEAATEIEWEYRVHNANEGFESETTTLGNARGWANQPGDVVQRRVVVGPWQEVPDE